MDSSRIAIINEYWNAGATRCARDLEQHLASTHHVRYLPAPEHRTETGLMRDLRAFAPDIIHCHAFYSWLPYQFLATISHQYPTCFTPHDTRPIGADTTDPICYHCPYPDWCFRCALVPRYRKLLFLHPHFWRRLQKRFAYQRTDRRTIIVAPSRWLQQRLQQTELRRFTIEQIPYGIDLDRFRPIADARQQLGWRADRKIVLFVTYTVGWKINPHKGLLHLTEAFLTLVLPQYPDAQLALVGGGLIPNHPNILPVGMVSQQEMPLYYTAADVCVAPSIADNLPYTVLEAMSCGAPVVASRVGGIPEEVEEGVTGYLYPPGDVQVMGEQLLALLAAPDRCRAMGQAGRRRAERLFSLSQCIQRYEAVYQEVLTRYRGRQS
jgi:glycosyltransferase involved in cell wall biosynthesis